MSKGGTNDNVFTQAAQAYNAAGGATAAAYDRFAGLGGYKPALAGEAAGYDAARVAAPGAIAGGIDRYINPYQETVIDNTINSMDRARRLTQQQNGDAAIAAGAFGGSRHGLVEAETNAGFGREVGNVTGELARRGWDSAAELASRDVANTINVNSTNASLLDRARAFAAGSKNQFALADQVARNQASQFGGQQEAVGAQGMLAAGRQAGDLGGEGVAIGQSINNQNAQAGAQQQAAIQALIDAAKKSFGGFTGQNADMLTMLVSALAGSPLNNQTTTTSQYSPGLFDYLALAAQTAASTYNPAKAAGT